MSNLELFSLSNLYNWDGYTYERELFIEYIYSTETEKSAKNIFHSYIGLLAFVGPYLKRNTKQENEKKINEIIKISEPLIFCYNYMDETRLFDTIKKQADVKAIIKFDFFFARWNRWNNEKFATAEIH